MADETDMIKSCHHCNGTELDWLLSEYTERAYVWCMTCQARGPLADTKEEATRLWNTRLGESAARPQALDKAANAIERH